MEWQDRIVVNRDRSNADSEQSGIVLQRAKEEKNGSSELSRKPKQHLQI
jgi:co-chaperonin GroES (HSP10)